MDKALVYRISFEGLDAQASAIGKLDGELSALNATVKKQREDLKLLDSLNQRNTASYSELEKALGENIVQSNKLSASKRDLIRETLNEAKSTKESEGSIIQLRAQLALATKEYNSLSKAERENAEVGGKVQARAKALSDELKSLESAIGDNRRNVGNYKSALSELEVEMKEVIASQLRLASTGQKESQVYKELDKQLTDLSKEYSETAAQANEADAKFKDLTGSANATAGSADSLKKQLREIKEAAALAGEGTEDFKRLTAEAAKLQDAVDDANEAIKQEKGTEFEKFREQLGGVGQSLGNLDFKQANERISNLGQTLKGLTFSSLKDGLKGAASSFAAFGKVLLSNPIFLFAAVVAGIGIALFALKDKVKIIGQAFEAIGTVINNTIQGVKNFSDAIGITSFKADAEAKKLSEDALKRYNADKLAFEQAIEDKIRAIDKEIAIQKSLGKDVTDLEIEKRKQIQLSLQEELKRTQALIKIKGLINANTAEEVNRIREIGIELDKLNTEITVIENNRIASQKDANDKKKTNQKKYNDDLNKNEKAAQEQLLKLQQENNLALVEDSFEKERIIADNENKAYKKSIEAAEISNELKILLLEEYKEKYIRTLNEISQREEDTLKKSAQDRLKLQTRLEEQGLQSGASGRANAPDPRDEQEKERQEKLQEDRANEIIANIDTANEVFNITQSSINSIAQLRDAETQANIARLQKEREVQLKAIQDSTLSEQAKAEAAININKAADEKILAERKKAIRAQKAFAIAQIAINTAQSLSAGIAGATNSALGTGIGAFVATPIFIATTIATILGAIAQATAVLKGTPEFEQGGVLPAKDGGFIRGNSHRNGGVKFAVGGRIMEAEGGEIIVNKNIQKRPDFVAAISQMNYLTGGKKFETGGIVSPKFSATGVNITAQQQLRQQGIDLPPIQVINNVTDTTTQQNSIIQTKNIASIGG